MRRPYITIALDQDALVLLRQMAERPRRQGALLGKLLREEAARRGGQAGTTQGQAPTAGLTTAGK
jgi:hypothetical protein